MSEVCHLPEVERMVVVVRSEIPREAGGNESVHRQW